MSLTGKQRAQRISRSYHSLPDPNIFWKRVLGLVGLVVGLLYAGWLFSATPGAKQQISTGELSKAHHSLSNDGCEKCHQPLTPIRSEALWGSHPEMVKITNGTCNGNCHQEKNKKVIDHFKSKTIPEVLAKESCSGCHQEHLGKDRNLNEVANSQCTRCHADLATSSTSNPPHIVATNFNKEHPILPFENPLPPGGNKPDPQTFKFSHIQHMRPGQPGTPGDRTAKKYRSLTDPKFQEMYRAREDANGLIQLTCSDCHERDNPIQGLEGIELSVPKIPANFVKPDSEHMLYKPVDFEKHCIACHALRDNLTHGLNKEQTIAELRKSGKAFLIEDYEDAQQIAKDPSDLESKVKERVEDRKRLSRLNESFVSDYCVTCHSPAPKDSPDVVVRPNVQIRWLDNASFNHGKHLMIGCIHCHKESYKTSDGPVDSVAETRQIMIGGLEKCRECHIEATDDRAKAEKTNPNVASADCTDCHRYHVDPGNEGQGAQKSQQSASLERPWASLASRLPWLQ